MLVPTKYNHPDRTVIYVSFLLLKILKKNQVQKYDDLQKAIGKLVVGWEVLFLPSLNLLYALGLIEYRPKSDILEYIGSK